MPRYIYQCQACNEIYELVHAMHEIVEECSLCNSPEPPKKIPALIGSFKIIEKEVRPGTVVRKFIKDAKQEVKEEKKSLQRRELK